MASSLCHSLHVHISFQQYERRITTVTKNHDGHKALVFFVVLRVIRVPHICFPVLP